MPGTSVSAIGPGHRATTPERIEGTSGGAAFVRVQPIFTWMSCRVLAQLAMRSAALERWR